MAKLSKLPQPGATCLPPATTDPQGKDAFVLRFGTATKEAVPTGTPPHPTNTDLTKFPDGLGTYTKALRQSLPGIVDPSTFDHLSNSDSSESGLPLASGSTKSSCAR